MSSLDDSQIAVATKALHDYMGAVADPATGQTPAEAAATLDANRRSLIAGRLGDLVRGFCSGAIALSDFKPELDGLNKRNEFWGFSGIKGQMFFNLLFNAAGDEKELTAELRAAIVLPETEEIARSRIRNFTSYVRRIGEVLVENGGSKHSRPKVTSIPFFLSYFWQVQAPDRWSIYYTNSVRVLGDLNLFQEKDDIAESYSDYQRLHEELRDLFSTIAARPMSLYDVEHVWSFVAKGQLNAVIAAPVVSQARAPAAAKGGALQAPVQVKLPDSYVPPIVAVIPQLATNDPALEEAAKASGTSIPRALEKSINAAFTMLGYETTLLGQGAGRVQDGLAISADDSYAILWDAKARQGGYKMGTDDRTIRDYITTQSRDLKKRRRFRNLYYVIVSSGFQDDFDDLIRGLKMETDVNEVCLIEADALVAMVDAKLRDPSQVTLGPDGLQRLLCRSGTLTADIVREEMA